MSGCSDFPSGARRSGAETTGRRAIGERASGDALVCAEQLDEPPPLEDDPFRETPRTAPSLILRLDPGGAWARMPEGLPEHREMIAARPTPDDVLHADAIGIAPTGTIGDPQRIAPTAAPTPQQRLIPPARRQLIPNECGDAARATHRQPRWPLAAGRALPPVSGHLHAPADGTHASPATRVTSRRWAGIVNCTMRARWWCREAIVRGTPPPMALAPNHSRT